MGVPHHYSMVAEEAVALVILYEFSSVAMIVEVPIYSRCVIEEER
jgi:hypothetical protein